MILMSDYTQLFSNAVTDVHEKFRINIISDIDNQASMDLCNLIGNMFDNAIEASQNSEKRFIYFETQIAIAS